MNLDPYHYLNYHDHYNSYYDEHYLRLELVDISQVEPLRQFK